MRVAGIQPGYLPWLGYFEQMLRVDVFIIADEMQFSSSGWTHRNRVRGPHGAHWLNLPARPEHLQRICDVRLDPSVPWVHDHLTTLRHFYAASRHAAPILAELAAVMRQDARRMTEASMPILRWLAEQLEITTPLVVSSEHQLERCYQERFPDQPGPTHRIIAFLAELGADELLEGESGQAYLDVALCKRHGIRVEFQRYAHPTYRQLHEPFLSHLSVLDLLLCEGKVAARRILRSTL